MTRMAAMFHGSGMFISSIICRPAALAFPGFAATIWLCVSCETCITRCPNEVDIARMMDVLRQMAIESGVAAKEKNILKFHEAFLANIRRGGRINEPAMMVEYKLKSGDLFSDMGMGIDMFLKGKLSLISPRTKDMASVRRIFDKTRQS